MFPGSWPGAGLLVLRLASGISLILGATPELRALPHSWLNAVHFLAIAVGVLLFLGLWTPIAGLIQLVVEVWMFFSPGDSLLLHFLLAALGASLVMLGPGAWSVDARLFGRKKIDINRR
jgi:uncharacterized membrane protein YphA (DoxX/SURF4 family)